MPPSSPKYGIAEWYGKSYLAVSSAERLLLANAALRKRAAFPCPFQEGTPACTKAGGVCSLRRVEGEDGNVVASDNGHGAMCITCPKRFVQGNMIYRWIGSELLGTEDVANLGEIGFLQRVTGGDTSGDGEGDEVGRIDNILVRPNTSPLQWCAVETQAVYFSGKGMASDFEYVAASGGEPTLPRERRRPDFRSSAPKRLMPQLQIKVPTLRRWGKKTAVVVDKAFFDSLGPMEFARDRSNADIAWFVVACGEGDPIGTLERVEVRYTTLDHAVIGLTAGQPVTQARFEEMIAEKIRLRGLA